MQTFSKANKGFTLIELMVVVAIVFMFAASISPRLVAVKNGQDFRQFVASLTSLPVYAREKSVSSGQKVELRFQGDTIQLVQVAVDLAETPIKTLPVLDGVRVSKAVKDKESAPTDSLVIAFYPDGTSEDVGVEFESLSGTFSIQVSRKTGQTKVSQTALPEEETTTDEWAAGELEVRGG